MPEGKCGRCRKQQEAIETLARLCRDCHYRDAVKDHLCTRCANRLPVIEYEVTDRDHSSEWILADLRHQCGGVVVVAARLDRYGRTGVDAEIEEIVSPCRKCGAEIDETELAEDVAHYFAALAVEGVEDLETSHV